jgi:hypothetical protein
MGHALLREWDYPEHKESGIPGPPRRKRRWFRWFALGILIVFVLVGTALLIAARHAEPFLRSLIVDRLSQRFHARVELDSFQISVAKGLWAEGKGLRIWPPSQVEGVTVTVADGKPLISLASFRFHAPLHYARGKPIRIYRIELRDIAINVPPKPHFTHVPEPAPSPLEAGPRGAELIRFQVGSVICTNARLTLETANPAKTPLVFDIQTVLLTQIADSGTMNFDAVLTNPRPKGLITAKGSLGPWMSADPGLTPVDGNYQFDHADMGVFRGISGTLDSKGKFTGALRNLSVDGQTDTPDFSLDRFGTPQPLHTDFHARVDGTDGNTWLEPVSATLGQSHFTARGKVVQVVEQRGAERPHSIGHLITLDVHVDDGQMADFLRLTSRSGTPLFSGTLNLRTKFELPPGAAPVHQRLRLNGRFLINDAHFTSSKVQDRIDALSLRGQGQPQAAKDPNAPDVTSTMTGDFTMSAGEIKLPDFVYQIPGAEIDLHGKYVVEGGAIEFHGTARMQATVSHMIGGWKGKMLTPVDRLFKKDGAGTKLKIHITGTRDDPHLGLDL